MNVKPITVQQHGQGRVFAGVAQAEWEAANALENQVWALLAICGAAVISDYLLRLWGSFAGLAV
jgi:hypothetical protein